MGISMTDDLKEFIIYLLYSGYYRSGDIIIPLKKAEELIDIFRSEKANGTI
jgi:hypothetical protein